MKKNNGSDFLHASGENWEDFQMVNPYTHEPIQTPKDFKEYVDEFFKETEARASHKAERLEKILGDYYKENRSLERDIDSYRAQNDSQRKQLAACRNENKRIKDELDSCRSDKKSVEKSLYARDCTINDTRKSLQFCVWVIVILLVLLITFWVVGWIYWEPSTHDQVETAYQAGVDDLNSRLISSWEKDRPDSYTLEKDDFKLKNFVNIEKGISWLEFCETVDMPRFYHQFPLEHVKIKAWKDTYEFTFENEKLSEIVKVLPTPSPSPKNDSSSQKSNSQKVTFPNDPSPTVEPGMAWVPTNGGKCYHRYETCSAMDEPEYVTIEEAISRGFTPCGKCW